MDVTQEGPGTQERNEAGLETCILHPECGASTVPPCTRGSLPACPKTPRHTPAKLKRNKGDVQTSHLCGTLERLFECFQLIGLGWPPFAQLNSAQKGWGPTCLRARRDEKSATRPPRLAGWGPHCTPSGRQNLVVLAAQRVRGTKPKQINKQINN